VALRSPEFGRKAVERMRPSIDSAIAVLGPAGPDRTLALAHLAAESVSAGDRVLWIGSQHLTRPLAWLPLREQRLDCRPPRPEFGVAPWPWVDPFTLQPAHLVDWLQGMLGIDPAEREGLSKAVNEVFCAGRDTDATPWAPPVFESGWARLAERLGVEMPRLEQGTNPGLDLDSPDLTVVSGHVQDLQRRPAEIALVMLAFASHAHREPWRRHLVVVEDWLDIVSEPFRGMVVSALLDVGRLCGGLVVLASTSPAAWAQQPTGRILFGNALPALIKGPALVGQEDSGMPSGAPPRAPGEIAVFDRFRRAWVTFRMGDLGIVD
jgi:hypothetical protein